MKYKVGDMGVHFSNVCYGSIFRITAINNNMYTLCFISSDNYNEDFGMFLIDFVDWYSITVSNTLLMLLEE